jgi:hypothetical protein
MDRLINQRTWEDNSLRRMKDKHRRLHPVSMFQCESDMEL